MYPTPWTIVMCELAARLHSAGGRQRRERGTLAMVATTNTFTGVSRVCVGRIPGMGDGGDRSAKATTTATMTRAGRIPPRGQRRCAS